MPSRLDPKDESVSPRLEMLLLLLLFAAADCAVAVVCFAAADYPAADAILADDLVVAAAGCSAAADYDAAPDATLANDLAAVDDSC